MTLAPTAVSRAFGGVRAVDQATFTGGKIELDGRRLDRLPPHRIAALGVTRTYQNIRLFGGLSALDNVVVGQHLRRRAPFWRRLLLLSSARREEVEARGAAWRSRARSPPGPGSCAW